VSEQRPGEVVQWAGVTRAGSLRLLAAALALFGGTLLGGSCLNPRPEELPSSAEFSPRDPRPTSPNGSDPGIGGDDLPPQFGEDTEGGAPGQTPINGQPATQTPPGNMNEGPTGTAADAGAPGGAVPVPDAGVDGG
jgi:hypothetical protein